MSTRTAVIRDARVSLAVVQRYLPSNYTATEIKAGKKTDILITGEDVAGWTMDGYVIPRLRSGNIYPMETTP